MKNCILNESMVVIPNLSSKSCAVKFGVISKTGLIIVQCTQALSLIIVAYMIDTVFFLFFHTDKDLKRIFLVPVKNTKLKSCLKRRCQINTLNKIWF